MKGGQGMLNCDGTGPATDVWIACSPSRGRAKLKSPVIMASKARLRLRKVNNLTKTY